MTRSEDDGFTLVELLVATAISGLLAVVIAAAFTVGVQTTSAANARLTASRGAPMVTSYFPPDVQSSATVTVYSTPCTSAVPNVATFSWVDLDSAGAATTKTVLYTCQLNGATTDLVRRYTAGSTTTSAVAAFDVSAATVTCTPNCAAPTNASLSVTSGGYSFSVTARRRLA